MLAARALGVKLRSRGLGTIDPAPAGAADGAMVAFGPDHDHMYRRVGSCPARDTLTSQRFGSILRAMRAARISLAVLVLASLAGCVSVRFGRDFPSPEEGWIVRGKTDRYGLVKMLGEPVQMGFDNGDPTWRWFYGQRDSTAEISKDLTVRFGPDSIVKSYSFTSSFPEDLRRLDDPRRLK